MAMQNIYNYQRPKVMPNIKPTVKKASNVRIKETRN
jgi:hypothetical protein